MENESIRPDNKFSETLKITVHDDFNGYLKIDFS